MEGYDIVSLSKALEIAEDMGMNLVAMNDTEVPVCKIFDYQKYTYEQQKKARQNKGSNKGEIKEVKFNPVIAEHDLEIKAKTAGRLLSEGNKVKVTINYKGRMILHISGGVDKLNQFNELVVSKHKVDKAPTVEGNRVYMIISPSK